MGHKKGSRRKKKTKKFKLNNKDYKGKENNNYDRKSNYNEKGKFIGEYEDVEIRKGRMGKGTDPICYIKRKACFIKKYTEDGAISYTIDEINEIFGNNQIIISDIMVEEDRGRFLHARFKDE